MSLHLRLLGPRLAIRDGHEVSLRGDKAWVLLARLLLTDAPVPRSRVIADLFPDASDPAGALRWNLSHLRRALGVEIDGDPLRLALPADATVDVALLRAGDAAAALSLDGLDDDLLTGVELTTSPAAATWLEAARRHTRRLVLDVRREATLDRLGRGDHAGAIRIAEAAAAAAPLDEDVWALLVRCLHLAGRTDDAADVARSATALLRDHLGIDPSARFADARRAVPGGNRHATGPMAVVAQLEAGEAALAAGAVDAGLQALRSAVVAARALGNRALLARALVTLGRALVQSVRSTDDDGPTLLHEALPIAEDLGDAALAAAAARQLGYVDLLRGRYARCFVWFDRARRATDDPATTGWVDVYEGVGRDDVGELQHAADLLAAASDLADRTGDTRLGTYATTVLGRQQLLTGQGDAVATLGSAVTRARRADWTSHVPFPESLLAEALRRHGALSRAAATAEHAAALAEQVDDPCYRTSALRALGLVRVDQAAVREGLGILTDLPPFCASVPDAYRWMHAWALDAVADATSAVGDTAATAWIERSVGFAQELGLGPIAARGEVYLGRTTGPPGRPAPAARTAP
ncbi:MAG: BTAD domain-containing putative transcriptional regulator [Actinomycetes bacterium]